MILSESDVESISHRREGWSGDVPFAVLLCALSRCGKSVTLTITRQSAVKEIIFESGVPVHCRSNLAHETLSRFMQGAGALDEAEESLKRSIRPMAPDRSPIEALLALQKEKR